jgi:hypothetical protein
MRSLFSRAAVRIGYHGMVLTVFGWLWICIGLGVLVNPDFNPQLIHTYLPVWARVALWSGVGLANMVLAWWPRRHDQGFFLLVIPPAERTLSYGWALVSGPTLGWLVATTVWLSLTIAVLVFARWPEPPGRPDAS